MFLQPNTESCKYPLKLQDPNVRTAHVCDISLAEVVIICHRQTSSRQSVILFISQSHFFMWLTPGTKSWLPPFHCAGWPQWRNNGVGRVGKVQGPPPQVPGKKIMPPGDLAIPCSRTTRNGQRSFAVFGPTLWNSLPLSVHNPSLTLTQFCALLKTVLFCRAYETLT